MSREWQPGDVALVRNRFGIWNRAIATVSPDGLMWRYGVADDEDPVEVMLGVCPLVVIDPENREQVERLGKLMRASGCRWSTDVQTALREFADPKPPKPDEPTGLGAVVVDADDIIWIRRGAAHFVAAEGAPSDLYNNSQTWGELDVVKVLSVGYEPNEEPLADWERDLLRGAR